MKTRSRVAAFAWPICKYPKELGEKLRAALDYHNFVLTKYLGVEAIDFQQTFDDAVAFGEYVEPMKCRRRRRAA
jgi:adenylosuccinate synthase